MSRTIRKPLRTIEENEENYIKKHLNSRFRRWSKGFDYSTRWVKRAKPRDQYKAEYDAAWSEYRKLLKKASFDEAGRPYIGYTYGYAYVCGKPTYTKIPDYLREPYVTRYHRVEIPWSVEQEVEDLKAQYRKFTRDGHWNETGRNTDFKKAAAKATRRGNHRLEHKILKDEDYDHLPYPNEHDGDYLRWSFW